MKNNTIKLALRAKIKELLDTVTNPEVKALMERDIMVCGGAIASMLLNERPNDYDIYFKTFETTEAVARYYVDKFNTLRQVKVKEGVTPYVPTVKVEWRNNIRDEAERRVIIYMKSAGIASDVEESPDYAYFEQMPEMAASEYVEANTQNLYEEAEEMHETLDDKKKEKFRPVFLTDNAITLSHKVQLVLRFYGSAEEIHKNYDYAHAMCSFSYSDSNLVLHQEALNSLLNKALIYRGSLYPIASLFRIRKFLKRGWSITAGQMLKIIWQVNDLDLQDKAVLRDQLIGVDQAYMSQLISVLSNREPGTRVDSIYIAKIIDEIFD